MRTFVTGGHGFLGKHLVSSLTTQGFDVVAPSRIECDLSDPSAITPFIQGCEVVVHAAADVGGLGYVQQNRLGLALRNIEMSVNVLRAAERAGVRFFISIGSACSYPDLPHALREEDFYAGPCHQSVEAYGAQKRALEMLGRQGPWVSLHLPLANLYGPGDRFVLDRAHVLTALTIRVVNARAQGAKTLEAWCPDTEREFLYVEDAADFVAAAVFQYVRGRRVPGDILNVGPGVCTRIDQIMTMIQDAAGAQIDVIWNTAGPRGVQRKVLDVSQLRAFVAADARGFTDLAFGIRRTVESYRQTLADMAKTT